MNAGLTALEKPTKMKLRFLAAVLFLTPVLASAQDRGSTLIYPGPVFTQVKAYLGLTDSQMQSLQSILDSRNQAAQQFYNQINQKYAELNRLLEAGTGTAAQIGQLMLDIRALQKQTPPDTPYRAQALNVLTADQKNKLPKLSEALQLQPAAGQAGMLLLIEYPQRGPVILPATDAPLAAVGAPAGAVLQ